MKDAIMEHHLIVARRVFWEQCVLSSLKAGISYMATLEGADKALARRDELTGYEG
jgi:hypothetical protein